MSQISCFGSLIAAFFRMGFGDCDYVKDLLVMAEKMVANIWPEFLGKIVSGVERNSCSHGHGKVTHGALVVRIISTGDAARSCGCEDFRSIENSPAGISPSHEDASRRLSGTRKERAASHSVVTRISVEDGRIYANTEKLTCGGVSEIGAEALAKSFRALPISVVEVSGLIDACFNSDSYEGKRIEKVLRDLCKFLSCGQRSGLRIASLDHEGVGEIETQRAFVFRF